MGYDRHVSFHFSANSSLPAELQRLQDGFTSQDLAVFDAVLLVQFAACQRSVHTISRSLKNSARHDSQGDSESWSGHIQYGGKHQIAIPSSWGRPSERGWVDYAPYEQRRVKTMGNGHAQHNFLKDAVEMADALYEKAIRAFVEG